MHEKKGPSEIAISEKEDVTLVQQNEWLKTIMYLFLQFFIYEKCAFLVGWQDQIIRSIKVSPEGNLSWENFMNLMADNILLAEKSTKKRLIDDKISLPYYELEL